MVNRDVGKINWLPGALIQKKKKQVISTRQVILYFAAKKALTAKELAQRVGITPARARCEISALVSSGDLIQIGTQDATFLELNRKIYQSRIYKTVK